MSLNEVWEAASASPYAPLISKDSQFSVGFTLLLSGKTGSRYRPLTDSTNEYSSTHIDWSFRTEPFFLEYRFIWRPGVVGIRLRGRIHDLRCWGLRLGRLPDLFNVPYTQLREKQKDYTIRNFFPFDHFRYLVHPAMADVEPIFSAVSSNAHHLYTLLQCIGFVPKATVLITPDGIRFSVEEGRVIQGLAFLDKALFTTYTFNPPAAPNSTSGDLGDGDDSSDATYNPCFVVSLSALLETLKIFGVNDPSSTGANKAVSVQPSNPSSSNAFTTPALLFDRSCTLQYFQNGSPLSITLSETGIKTTCELTTYEPDGGEVDIPLQRDAIIMKVIMRSAWLHNAIVELGATNPNVLKISASADREPFFALSGSGGPFSESSVEFSIEEQGPNNGASSQSRKVLTDDGTSRSRAKRTKLAPTVTETFLVSPPSSMGSRIKQNYRFSLMQKASRAMSVANKVSIRGDRQGVLSLQFMIEFDAHGSSGASNTTRPSGGSLGPTVTFVDFRFVPLLDDEEAADEDSTGDLE